MNPAIDQTRLLLLRGRIRRQDRLWAVQVQLVF